MQKIILFGSLILVFAQCNSVDLKQSCQGEWSYIVGDTAYCELLINDSIVYTHHYGHLNGQAHPYSISNDTFFLYGNNHTESSPIHYLGTDSFKILGITPSTLKRVKHKNPHNHSLARYYYKLIKFTRNKDIHQLFESNAFPKMLEAKKMFEPNFQQRRSFALYKRPTPKTTRE